MPIVVRNDPSFNAVGNVALQTGYGIARQRQEDIKRQQASQDAQRQHQINMMREQEQNQRERMVQQNQWGMDTDKRRFGYNKDLAKTRHDFGMEDIEARRKNEEDILKQRQKEARRIADQKGLANGTRAYPPAVQKELDAFDYKIMQAKKNEGNQFTEDQIEHVIGGLQRQKQRLQDGAELVPTGKKTPEQMFNETVKVNDNLKQLGPGWNYTTKDGYTFSSKDAASAEGDRGKAAKEEYDAFIKGQEMDRQRAEAEDKLNTASVKEAKTDIKSDIGKLETKINSLRNKEASAIKKAQKAHNDEDGLTYKEEMQEANRVQGEITQAQQQLKAKEAEVKELDKRIKERMFPSTTQEPEVSPINEPTAPQTLSDEDIRKKYNLPK